MVVTEGIEVQGVKISPAEIEAANRAIDPLFLGTPQFVDPGLAAHLGCELLLKVETLNPIKSFKGRGASWTMQSLAAKAVAADSGIERVICASAGNFGQAIAYAGRTAGIPVTVFAATTANTAKILRIREFGAEVVLTGHDFDAAKEAARAYAEATAGVRFIEDAADLETVIGAGTIGLELAPEKLDLLLVPLGNGALVNGIATWLNAHSPDTRIAGICAAGAPSMYESWKAKKVIATETAATIADGIAVRLPISSAVHLTTELVDDVVLVEEAEIREALRVVRDHAGLLLEPSGVIGIAALLAYPDLRHGRVGTILTGANLSPQLLAELTGS